MGRSHRHVRSLDSTAFGFARFQYRRWSPSDGILDSWQVTRGIVSMSTTITFACSSCGTTNQVPKKDRGSTTRCTACGSKVEVPWFSTVQEPMSQAPPATHALSPQPWQQQVPPSSPPSESQKKPLGVDVPWAGYVGGRPSKFSRKVNSLLSGIGTVLRLFAPTGEGGIRCAYCGSYVNTGHPICPHCGRPWIGGRQ